MLPDANISLKLLAADSQPARDDTLPRGAARRLLSRNLKAPERSARTSYSHYSWRTGLPATFSVHAVLGNELRKTRLRAGLTQESLAFKAGISRNYVSLLELDQKSPTVAVLLRLCRAMQVKASRLIAKVEDHV